MYEIAEGREYCCYCLLLLEEESAIGGTQPKLHTGENTHSLLVRTSSPIQVSPWTSRTSLFP